MYYVVTLIGKDSSAVASVTDNMLDAQSFVFEEFDLEDVRCEWIEDADRPSIMDRVLTLNINKTISANGLVIDRIEITCKELNTWNIYNY